VTAVSEAEQLPAVAAEPPSMLALIARAAADPATDVAKMQSLLAMQRELIADEARAQFNEAFARLQPRLPRVKKNGEVWYPIEKAKPDGPQKRAFRYAKWEDIDLAIRPLLNAEGFSLSFDTDQHASGGYLIIGKLLHAAGHEKTATFGPVPLDTSGGKNNLQGAASSLSYGKRHTGSMLLNLVFEGDDDDGTGGPIDASQVKIILDLVKQANAGPRFLRYMNALSVEEAGSLEAAAASIAYRDYPKAVSALNDLIRKKGKASADPS
jgi:hypothetical protein